MLPTFFTVAIVYLVFRLAVRGVPSGKIKGPDDL
jgi:hypothetical protein